MVVSKAVNMAKEMHIPILGLVENYIYVECPTCKEKIEVFGKSHAEETAKKFGLNLLGKLPLNPKIAEAIDAGKVEELEGDWLDAAADYIENQVLVNDDDEEIVMKPE